MQNFINKSIKKFGVGRFGYDKCLYHTRESTIELFCSNCNEYVEMNARGHLESNTGCPRCSFKKTGIERKNKAKEKFFKDIEIKDSEKRWNYDKAKEEYDDLMLKSIHFICNGCNLSSPRTPYKHITYFQPCKRRCFTNREIDTTQLTENIFIDIEEETVVDSIEEWKNIIDNENYSVSNKGNVKNNKTNTLLNGSILEIGYHRVGLMYNRKVKQFFIHRLVAEAFIPNPENKKTVNHKSKNRSDNRLENLEWATSLEQNIHKNIKNKNYTEHRNGKPFLRIEKESGNVIEEYPSIMLACIWILQNIMKIDVQKYDIKKQAKALTASLSEKIKRNPKLFVFENGFIWKFKEQTNILENEIWKDIPIELMGSEGYQISSYGRFKNKDGVIKERFSIVTGGYYEIKIEGKHHRINRLVAQTFISNPESKDKVNHIDGNKLNNRLENLEWTTNQENMQHAYDTGLNKNVSPVTQYDITGTIKIKDFKSIKDASIELNIQSSQISQCCRGVQKSVHGFVFKYNK